MANQPARAIEIITSNPNTDLSTKEIATLLCEKYPDIYNEKAKKQ